MKTSHLLLAIIPAALAVSACSMFQEAPHPVALTDQPPIKSAAAQFIHALAAGDESALAQTTTVDADPATQKLASLVLKDTATARRLQVELAKRFDADSRPSLVGSEAWLTMYQDLSAQGPMLQANQRARIGNETSEGVMFLRQINGTWKVELVPTLVAESGGHSTVSDAAVDYRFEVSAAYHQMLLDRLENDEFHTYRQYRAAENDFWTKYLALIFNGEEPHDKLMPSLPLVPKGPDAIAENR